MLYKETEHEKISMELLNKLVPMETLNSYYLFGFAQAVVSINDVVNHLKFYDERDKENLLKLLKTMVDQESEIKSYYGRLSK